MYGAYEQREPTQDEIDDMEEHYAIVDEEEEIGEREIEEDEIKQLHEPLDVPTDWDIALRIGLL